MRIAFINRLTLYFVPGGDAKLPMHIVKVLKEMIMKMGIFLADSPGLTNKRNKIPVFADFDSLSRHTSGSEWNHYNNHLLYQ